MPDAVAASADEVKPLRGDFRKNKESQVVDRCKAVGGDVAGITEDARGSMSFVFAFGAVKARAEIPAVRRWSKVRQWDRTRCAVKDDGG